MMTALFGHYMGEIQSILLLLALSYPLLKGLFEEELDDISPSSIVDTWWLFVELNTIIVFPWNDVADRFSSTYNRKM